MVEVLPVLLAGGLAFVFTLLETCTSRYPTTCKFLLKNSYFIYIYSSLYGALALVFMLLLSWLTSEKYVVFTNSLSNPWLHAALVGLATKAILHINVYTANLGTVSVPVGLETFLYLFEPFLIRKIDLENYNLTCKYIDERIPAGDVAQIKKTILKNVPSIPEYEWKAFKIDGSVETLLPRIGHP